MTLLDTSVLSSFAAGDDLEALMELVGPGGVSVTPAVYAELRAGLAEGRHYLADAVDLVETGRLELAPLAAEEIIRRQSLPSSLGEGEAESIAVCRLRRATLATNDRRARNLCRSQGIRVLDLPGILRSLWRLGIRTKPEVRELLDAMQKREGIVIRGAEAIFAG